LDFLLSVLIEKFRFHHTAVPLVFHVVFATPDTLIVPWDELPVDIRVRVYQPSCHNCFHLAMLFKFVGNRDFASALATDDNRWATNSADMITISVHLFR
jgi:hypothetical protein